MRREIAKAALVGLAIFVFILWVADRRDLPGSLVVALVAGHAVVLPITVVLFRLGRR